MTNGIFHTNIPNVLKSASVIFFVSVLFISSSSVIFGGLPAFAYSFIAILVCLVGYLGWRGVVQKRSFPKSGLEIPLLGFLVGAILSLAFSSNPSVGLDRVAQLILLMVLFYIQLDVFESRESWARVRTAFLWVSGFVILVALLETYVWYLSWWAEVGSYTLPPFQYRFTGLTLHSSFFMMIVNMCAPLATVTLFKAESRATRFGSMLWLFLYLLAAPFSSSRAGWIGAMAWVFTLIALFMREKQNRVKFFNYLWAIKKILIPALVIGIAVLLVATGNFYRSFAGDNPTHGGGTALNREMIWGSAFTLIKSSPWVGIGPGQVTRNLMPASQKSPFQFWPINAHSTPLQVLTEFGIIGFVSIFVLVVLGIYQGGRILLASSDSERVWLWASVASLAAVAVQAVFDDATSSFFPMVLIVFHVASILRLGKSEHHLQSGSLTWLVLPLLVVAAITGMTVWANLPFYYATGLAEKGDWAAAARMIEQSIQRRPSEPGYWNQAGMAWTRVWYETGDSRALATARSQLEKNLSIEPGNSLVWANLAILDWHAGQREQALIHMRKAIEIAPTDSFYPLNYGSFLEQVGDQDGALQQYELAIVRFPEIISHPFWQSSPTRERALSNVATESLLEAIGTPYWKLARSAMEANDFEAARWNLALSNLYYETPSVIAAGRAELAKRQGKADSARSSLETVLGRAESDYWGVNAYPIQFNRFPFEVVPGFLKLVEDGGQFEAMEELLDIQIKDGDCQEATRTWVILQRALQAGAWSQNGYPPAPVCP